MECRKCKKEIPENSVFCNHCGTKQEATPRKKRRGNGEGSVYKRGDTYEARIILGYWIDDKGKVHTSQRTKGGFKTKREALEYIPELKKGTTRNPDVNITFQQLYERWRDDHCDKVTEHTMVAYRSAFGHFKPVWGAKFRSLGTDDLQACLDKGNASRRTKELLKTLAQSLYKYAAARQIVTHNCAAYLYVGKDKKNTRPAFTSQQVEMIRMQATAGDVRAIYTYCLIYLGFRPGEMLALTRGSYHKDGDVEYFIGGGKTEAGTDRLVPISPKIKPYLYQLVLKANPYIFPRENGKRMSDQWFRDHLFYPLLADLNIQPIPDKDRPAALVPYSCRHTFSNLLKNVDGPDKDKASLIGHTDYAFTVRQYQSAELENLVAIVNKI